MTIHMPNLEQFLGCYFHKDFLLDWPTADAALEAYLSEWPIEEIPKVLSELKLLLAQPDKSVERCAMKLGCDYNPAADGLSYREWLNGVADRLNSFLTDTPRVKPWVPQS